MSSPWPVRDLASCLNLCTLPLVSNKSVPVVHYSKGQRRLTSIINSQSTKDCACREITTMKGAADQVQKTGEPRRNPHSSEEDFIVFRFEENGDVFVYEDRELTDKIECPRTVVTNPKLKYGENVEAAHKKNKNQEAAHGIHIQDNKGGSSSNNNGDGGEKKEIISHVEETNNEDKAGASVESIESKRSDGSSGSFSFPVLSWEWTGSPVQMPQPDKHPRKSKARCVRFQCFSF